MTQIWQMTATEIAEAVRSGEMSATEVAKAHLDRLDAVNPQINAVVQDCRADALEAAGQVDAAIARGDDPGVLCGVPVTIKVNVDQKGHATTNGLAIQKDLIADHDSPVVSNIRKAGGVIVGRTNTPAFSMRWFTTNGLPGQTLTPRDTGLTPGGSSGGASAAVAAGICALGHGTDIAGSIRYPAYACGLHGLRPTLGRVPAYNASGADRYIGAQVMAVSGPIARSIADIELGLSAMAAANPLDPWNVPIAVGPRAFAKRAALTIAPDGMPVADEVRAALQKTAEVLRSAGWTVDEVTCPPMRAAAAINACLWMADTQLGARAMIAKEADPDANFVFDQISRDAGAVGFTDRMGALQARVGLMRQWDLFLQEYPLFICPVSGELPFVQQLDVRSTDDVARVFEAQLTQRGLPVVGVPSLAVATGETGSCPVGVQLTAPKFREDILIAAGCDIEAVCGKPAVAMADV